MSTRKLIVLITKLTDNKRNRTDKTMLCQDVGFAMPICIILFRLGLQEVPARSLGRAIKRVCPEGSLYERVGRLARPIQNNGARVITWRWQNGLTE